MLVGARKAGSTIATWVVTNAQGDYRFPRERMEPGEYTIRVRAVGYKLPATSVDVAAHGTKLDLQLQKVTRATELGMQLSNTEWLMSVPSTQAQKVFLSGCVNCHTLQRVLLSRFDAQEMAQVVQRMRRQHETTRRYASVDASRDDCPLSPPAESEIAIGRP